MLQRMKSIGVVAGLTVVSRVLGLVRDQLIAAVFGVGMLNSAFVTAFRLPNLFRRLLGEGSLTAALVPTLQQEIHRRGRGAGFELVSQVASWLLVVSGTLVGLGMLACSQSRLWAGQEERWYIGADLTVLLFPYLVSVCLAAVFSATLNVLERFTEAALSPILLNLSMIACLGGAGLAFADTGLGRMRWLCAGVLLGGVLQMLVPALALLRLGWRPRFDLRWSEGVAEIARLMAPGLWGVAVYQFNLLVAQLLAMWIDDHAAAALFLSNRLMELPIGVFAIAISTVVFPAIARHAAAGDLAAMGEDYRQGIRLILLVNLPAAVGLALLAEPIVRLLFERGAFTATATALTAPLLAWFAIGMPFFAVISLMTRAFYARKDTRTPVRAATASFLVNLVLSLVLIRPLGAIGLVLSSTAAVIVQAALLQGVLARQVYELRLAPIFRDVVKILLATLLMGGLVAAGWWGWLRGRGAWGDWMALLALIPAGMVVYGAVLWSLKPTGREELLQLLLRRRRARR